jgi:hypothetical protein
VSAAVIFVWQSSLIFKISFYVIICSWKEAASLK